MSNRLATETSPYLRQHADNPVHWWPWCAAALDAARAQDKPILLSIGYSACHWCHVMAHESFEDPVTAAAMNEKFICIKVDREERPDLDKIYQLAHQALTQRGGGWPLTMFLAADDLTPFYAGTYFPREARYGMPPFGYVLEQVRGFWDQRRDAVRTQNATLREFLAHYGDSEPTSTALSDTPINAALAQIERNFDSTYGGHRGAPKFPHGAQMELLLAIHARRSSGNFALALKSSGSVGSAYASMVDLSLTRMAEGGIHDQIGGGFCRYSVDERWEIPHFEKMLYDNAQLLPLYAQAARAAQSEPAGADSAAMYRQTALDLVAWLQREMTSPDGAFYAALDADSEGEEGRFYVWQAVEVRALLSADEFAVVERRFGFDRAANFEQHAWNPIIATSIAAIASALELADDDVKAHLQHAREKLFIARARRVRPALDYKILTAWNALMIGGLARASRDIDSGKLMPLAERALDFIHTQLWQNGRLFASHAGGSAKFAGYLDDYAFLLDALLEMLINRWSERDIAWAMQLADGLLEHFEDRERGGFWFTANDHEALIQRPKPWTDDAIPSGNGIAARALLRLGHLSGETRYLDAAERTLRAGFASMSSMPQGCASLQCALLDYLHPRAHIVLRCGSTDEANIWRRALASFDATNTDSYFIPSDAAGLRGVLDAQKYIPGGVAYVCRGVTCAAPITDPEKLS